MNCLNPTPDGDACGQCESCRAIQLGNSFNIVELDAASNNGVDHIRDISEQVNIPPQIGKYRIFIIDEVHMLSPQAFNAFLKTLEEPPKYVIFILATTEKQKVIPTILSRCQIYDFKRITVDDIVEHLSYVASQEGITADPKALGVIARKADGAMRDALSIFDQVAAACHGNLTYEAVTDNLNVLDYDYFFKLIDDFRRGDVPDALLLYAQIRDRGFDSLFFINSLAQHVRDLMVAADKRTVSLLETPADVAQKLTEQASQLPVHWYYAAMGLLNDCDYQYRNTTNKQLLVELTLIRLCQLLNPAPAPFDRPLQRKPLRDPAPQHSPAPAEANAGTQTPPPAPAKPARPATPSPAPYDSAAPAAARAQETLTDARQTGRPRRAARIATISLSHQTDDSETTAKKRDTPFSDEDLLNAWTEAAAHTDSTSMLRDVMRDFKPVRQQDADFLLTLQHPAQLGAFEKEFPEILLKLRDAVQNDFLSVRAIIDPKMEDAFKPLPPQEFLKKVIEQNPGIGRFLKEIDGELV